MKTYVITLSRKFPKGHRKEGEKTFFKEQLQNALLADAGLSACDCCKYETRDCGACGHENSHFHKKLHTIRANYDLWAKRFEEIERGEACISVREWTDKPYRSPQVEIVRLTRGHGIGIQQLKWGKGWSVEAFKLDTCSFYNNNGNTCKGCGEWLEDNQKCYLTLEINQFTQKLNQK